jgi:hypothetical protein
MIIRKLKNNLGFILAFGLLFFGLASQFYGQTVDANESMRKINIKFEDFRYKLNANLNRENLGRDEENKINDLVNNLEDAIFSFGDKVENKTETPNDFAAVRNATEDISELVARSKFDAIVQNSWKEFRGLVTRLSESYSNTTVESSNNNPRGDSASFGNGLTGSYKLDVSRSDNARDIVLDATQNSPQFEKDAAMRQLEEKLESPDSIAIETNGSSVSIETSKSSRVSIDASGNEKIQRTADGKNVRIRSDLNDNELTVSIEQEAQRSNRLRDYSYIVTFTSMENGRVLRVVRRLTDDEINQTFIVTSYYEKTSDDANGIGSNNSSGFPTATKRQPPVGYKGRSGDYIVADGAILTGILQDNVSTKVSQNRDRFRLKIQSPSEYRGTIVEGYISGINRSGRVSGSSKITFNFEKILLSNGETYDFAAFIQNITDTNGKTVKIDEEGTASGKSQTKETIKRGSIGAGAGAILGAIFGGAKGAIIGATIGGGAGAGSVIVTGKEEVELTQGSTLTIQSSSPIK